MKQRYKCHAVFKIQNYFAFVTNYRNRDRHFAGPQCLGKDYRSKMRGNQRISLKLDEDQNNPDKTLTMTADNGKEFSLF